MSFGASASAVFGLLRVPDRGSSGSTNLEYRTVALLRGFGTTAAWLCRFRSVGVQLLLSNPELPGVRTEGSTAWGNLFRNLLA